MALINCTECSKEISDKAVACPNCGTPVEKVSEKLIEEKMIEPSGANQKLRQIAELAKIEKRANEEKRRNEADKQETENLNFIGKIILMAIVLLLVFFGIGKFMNDRDNEVKADHAIALKKAQDETELLNKKKFLAEKSNVLKQIIEYSEANKCENALALCSKYVDINDKDLNPLCAEVKDKLERKALAAQKAIDEKESEERWKAAEKEKAKQEAELKASMSSKAWKVHKKHPSWSTQECKNVSEGRYWIGMSTDMMVASLGRPNSAKPSDYGNGKQWQYCYTDGWFQCFYDQNDDGIIDLYN